MISAVLYEVLHPVQCSAKKHKAISRKSWICHLWKVTYCVSLVVPIIAGYCCMHRKLWLLVVNTFVFPYIKHKKLLFPTVASNNWLPKLINSLVNFAYMEVSNFKARSEISGMYFWVLSWQALKFHVKLLFKMLWSKFQGMCKGLLLLVVFTICLLTLQNNPKVFISQVIKNLQQQI